ncbi:Na(+)-translocating NADH-quinone reductase subunit B [Polystyrenella longa]|uniref:Na(+)-translocating NADH-quinone reductase subunit B n=1 Tax=Polystyrenella longa TaxID=2528007 RepID=A0A518CRL6_9PLAN|nr:NADH:ubiquinone reductase (Na(+)-transporting) subunit B [Polystyrenella longa]QDU81869.1 Na(+)-translocating NADH-quinone reductase subunit B [Polystyrenella longa]
MKPLRKILDRVAPNFEEGGKWEKLYPLYEAGDTFLYTPGEVAKTNSHVRDAIDLKRMMSMVIVALLPAIYMALYNTGYQANLNIPSGTIPDGWRADLMQMLGLGFNAGSWLDCIAYGALHFLPVYIVTMSVGGAWEALFSIVRKHEINEGFLVTGMLFPLTLPPTIPLWQVAIGISFGVVIGKEIFGGTGRNFLNPALTARAFLYFAYPAQISGDTVWTAVDGYSQATPLGAAAAGGMDSVYASGVTLGDAFLGTIQGSMGETSALACLIGAAILIITGIGSWRIMVSVVMGALAFSSVLFLIGSESNPMFQMNPIWHLAVGGFAFGTVYMATDPVSASMTERGKWFYGFLIGAMTILIRVVNPAFPEGIMLAILFGNVFAPLIDYFVIQANIKRRLARNAA